MKESGDKIILVSACLVGVECRYDGKAKPHEGVLAWLKGKHFVPVCPECLSGLPRPRPAARFDRGDGRDLLQGRARLFFPDGTDVSAAFLHGAHQALKIAQLTAANEAVLKDRSPSCGVHEVYNQGTRVPGVGCFTALLLADGVEVKSEDEI